MTDGETEQCARAEHAPAGDTRETGDAREDSAHLPYPSLAPVVFFCLQQGTRPRSWCLSL
ncbi:voltage-dependent T-type calcium channel subunit alpha-1H isoform X1, partial [Tachysurus ichikawai]